MSGTANINGVATFSNNVKLGNETVIDFADKAWKGCIKAKSGSRGLLHIDSDGWTETIRPYTINPAVNGINKQTINLAGLGNIVFRKIQLGYDTTLINVECQISCGNSELSFTQNKSFTNTSFLPKRPNIKNAVAEIPATETTPAVPAIPKQRGFVKLTFPIIKYYMTAACELGTLYVVIGARDVDDSNDQGTNSIIIASLYTGETGNSNQNKIKANTEAMGVCTYIIEN